jgi:AcrR family transcriptional regulator
MIHQRNRRSTAMPRKKTVRPEHIVDAALRLAAARGWHAVSLADIAAEAGLSVLQLYAVFRSKAAILEAFHRRVDEAALGGAAEEGEAPRDRLFDALMRRFDALKPHKPAIAAMARDAWSDPLATLCSAPSLRRSMRWMLECSGVSTTGWPGRLRSNLLLGIYLSVLRVWLVDESVDMMKTMAALDRRLRQSERWLGLARGDSSRDSEAATSA